MQDLAILTGGQVVSEGRLFYALNLEGKMVSFFASRWH
jgi:hypothetical protein